MKNEKHYTLKQDDLRQVKARDLREGDAYALARWVGVSLESDQRYEVVKLKHVQPLPAGEVEVIYDIPEYISIQSSPTRKIEIAGREGSPMVTAFESLAPESMVFVK